MNPALFFVLFLLLATPVSAWALPQCLSGMTSRPALASYVTYLNANANVLRVLDACKLGSGVRAKFLDKLEEAELAGAPPTAPVPAEFLTIDANTENVVHGGAQTDEILGAKLAHVLWVEVDQRVAWRLASYNDADLGRLFTPCKFPSAWCWNTSNPSFMAQDVLDYSPRVAWDLVASKVTIANLTSPQQAMGELLKHGRAFIHGSGSTAGGIRTLDQMALEQVSRSGCWSMVPYVTALAQALNIPGEGIDGYYAATGHATALFPFSNQVLSHGDDPYDALMGDTPSGQVFDTYTHWTAEVLKKNLSMAAIRFNSQKHVYEMARTYPAFWLMDRYCAGGGRGYLNTTFGAYASGAQLDALEGLMRSTSASCTAIPVDNPDSP